MRGGGTAIFIKLQLPAKLAFSVNNSMFKLSFIDVGNSPDCYRLVCVYRPPATGCLNEMACFDLCNTLSDICRCNRKLVVCGDFNLPNINWNSFDSPDDSVHDMLLNKFSDLGLHQMVLEPTRDNNIFGIILVRDSLTFLNYTIDQPSGTSDPNSILFNLTFAAANL